MTATLTADPPLPPLRRIWADAPGFAGLGLLIALALLPLGAALALDSRVFLGESPWIKPVKFHLALSVYMITLAFYARYLPQGLRGGRIWRLFSAAVILAVLAEVAWLSAAASVNAASHFNRDDPVFAALYPVMGALAVLLTSASLVMGIAIWRNPATGLAAPVRLSVALGLILTFVATVLVAGALSSGTGHFVGTSTRALAVMGWSRDAGDLRVAHFWATHALHVVPLAGLVIARLAPAALASRLIWGAAALYAAFVGATFLQAQAGHPFLPALG